MVEIQTAAMAAPVGEVKPAFMPLFTFRPADEAELIPLPAAPSASPPIMPPPTVEVQPEVSALSDAAPLLLPLTQAPPPSAPPPAPAAAQAPLSVPDIPLEPGLPQFPVFQFGHAASAQPAEELSDQVSAPQTAAPPRTVPRIEAFERLPEHGIAYFQQILAQIEMFPVSGDPADCVHGNPFAIEIIQCLSAKSEEGVLTWQDLDRLEIALLQVMPETTLRSQAWSLRARYFETAGSTLSALYLASQSADWNDAAVPVEKLRADLETLVLETQKNRVQPPLDDPAALNLSEAGMKWTLGLCLGGVAGYLIVRLMPIPVEILPLIPFLTALLSGAVGGGFSLPARLSHAALPSLPQRERLLPILEPPSLYRFPVQGAILAALFYLLLLSGYLKGALFPPSSTDALATPEGGARLIAWCFLLGVIARFLPDAPRWLRRFQSQRKAGLSS